MSFRCGEKEKRREREWAGIGENWNLRQMDGWRRAYCVKDYCVSVFYHNEQKLNFWKRAKKKELREEDDAN